jgi:hypothetical protein
MGREFAKGNVAASETTASDRRARGGGVIDTLAKANRSVLTAQWGRRPRNMVEVFGDGWGERWREGGRGRA